MASVVIPAHNEGALIGDCLDALLADSPPSGRPQIVVVANGCTDDTIEHASRRPGVTVVDIAEAGKPAALNAGDALAHGFPRIYLDADIVAPPGAVAALDAALSASNQVLAAVPQRRLNLIDRPWPVRAYFAINQRHPAFQSGLFGRGMIGLSERGRARFENFPPLVADDLFLDSLFSAEEKETVSQVTVVVEAPRRTRDLVQRLVRVRRGNAAMRAASRAGAVATAIRPPNRLAWLRTVVLPNPRLAPAAVVYVVLTAWAALRARLTAGNDQPWERDESTRIRSSGPSVS